MITRKAIIWSCILIAVLFTWLRWPRIEKDMVRAMESEITPDGVINEYRANWPFRVRHAHAIREPIKNLSQDPHVFLGSYTPIQQTNQFIDSRYDWLRGEYFARLKYSKSDKIPRVEFGDQNAEFPPKLPATDNPARWQLTLESGISRKHFISADVTHVLNETSDQSFTEYILVYLDVLK